MVAQAAGAVGLVVINDEPGGVTFAMPGARDLETDAEGSGVDIPVAMVSEKGANGWSGAGGAPLERFLFGMR